MFKEQTGFLLVFTINDYNVKMSTWVNVCRPKPQILKTDMIKCDNTVDAWHFVIPYIKDIKREQNHSFRFPNTQRNHFINLSYQSFQLSYNTAIHVLHFVSKLKKTYFDMKYSYLLQKNMWKNRQWPKGTSFNMEAVRKVY